MKRIIALLLCAVMVVTMTSCAKKNGEGEDTTAAESTGDYNSGDIALQGQNYSISLGELSYVFYENYQEFIANNRDNLNVYGLDTTASIKNQTYYGTTTWFQYFADAAVGYARDILLLCEAANAAGVALDETDSAAIESSIQAIVKNAVDNGYSTEDMLALTHSANVSLDVVRSFMEKQALGLKYYSSLTGQYQFTDEEMNQYVAENPDKFNCVSYLSYTFDEDKDPNAEASAEELSHITDPEDFESFLKDYMANTLNLSEEAASAVAIHTYYATQKSDSEFSTWAFGENAATNQTHTEFNEVDGQFTVYLLTKTPSLQDYTARNIRYIYLSVATYSTYAQTLAKANELLTTWQSGEATDASFGELAGTYSEDATTSYIGGLALEVSRQKGATSFPDKLISWLYSDDTAMGTAQVIKGDSGYYVAYYSSDGEIEWQYEAKSGLAAARYQQDYDSMSAAYPVTTNDEVVSAIDA